MSIDQIRQAKNAEVQELTDKVFHAQNRVSELQAIVESLNEKKASFANLLATAETRQDRAMQDLEQVQTAANDAATLYQSITTLNKQANESREKTDTTAAQISELLEQLSYAIDFVDKLQTLVTMRKAENPTIPDELLAILTQASQDSNTAMAASLTAFNSCSQAAYDSLQASSLAAVGVAENAQLLALMTGQQASGVLPARELQLEEFSGHLDAVYKAETEVRACLYSDATITEDIDSQIISENQAIRKLTKQVEKNREEMTRFARRLEAAEHSSQDSVAVEQLRLEYSAASDLAAATRASLVSALNQFSKTYESYLQLDVPVQFAQQKLISSEKYARQIGERHAAQLKRIRDIKARIQDEQNPDKLQQLNKKLATVESRFRVMSLYLEHALSRLATSKTMLAASNENFVNAAERLQAASDTVAGFAEATWQPPLLTLLSDGKRQAIAHYNQMLLASAGANKELEAAQARLNVAENELRSLRSGLEAATAAVATNGQ
ncbi:MAG: hypothetical protein AAF431_11740 [Pseudomonadota bacterium]